MIIKLGRLKNQKTNHKFKSSICESEDGFTSSQLFQKTFVKINSQKEKYKKVKMSEDRENDTVNISGKKYIKFLVLT